EQGLQENIFFDPNTKAVAYDDSRYVMDPWMKKLDYEYSAKEVSPGVVRILDTIAEALPRVGWVFVTKGNKMPNRISPAIHSLNSDDINLSNINIYHAGSMGLIAEKSKNVTLDRFNVTIAPGSKRLMSSAADATHFAGCRGLVSITNCLFENMHDDGVNIHGVYALLENTIDEHTVAFKLNHVQQFGFEFAVKGDSVRLVERATLTPYATLVVKDIKKINEEYSYLIFSENINTLIKPNSAIENVSCYPANVIIKGCTIKNNRARGILISTSGKVEITNNYFSNEMAGIVIGGDANFWWESGPVNNVLIKNNKFYNCCTSKSDQAVVMVDPIILKPDQSKSYFERNIVIEGNTFETFDNPILKVKSTNGLRFVNNRIIQTKTFKPFYANVPGINVTYSSNISVENNSYQGDQPLDVAVDAKNVVKVAIKGNKGFRKSKH
ncbi:MAG TPA: right-handed parallel beta-helix repeat-containing protein, partial [Cytophagaceae bacterium]